MKKALILGSSGFIGGHLVKVLKDDGYWVIGADIQAIRYPIFSPNDYKQGDLRDMQFVISLFDTSTSLPININNPNQNHQYTEIYQLAADSGGTTYINTDRFNGSIMANSSTINANVARCLAEYQPTAKFFFASSACVYPQNKDGIATCHENDVYPAFPDNEYGWEKLFSERMYKNYAKQYNLNIYIARFHSIVGDYGVYMGPRSTAHSALAYKVATVPNISDNVGGGSYQQAGIVEVLGDGTQLRTFLYVKDCIKAIRALMATQYTEIVNIGSDELISIKDYVDILKNISHKSFNIKYVTAPPGVKYRYCDITAIQRECNWEPETSIEETALITYNFIIENCDTTNQWIQ